VQRNLVANMKREDFFRQGTQKGSSSPDARRAKVSMSLCPAGGGENNFLSGEDREDQRVRKGNDATSFKVTQGYRGPAVKACDP